MEAGEEKGSTDCGNRQEVVIADLCPFGFIGKSKPLELLCGQGEHGFEDAAVADLQQKLKNLVRKTQPFAKRIPNSGIWVEPRRRWPLSSQAKSTRLTPKPRFMKGGACPLRRAIQISTRSATRSAAFTPRPEYQAVLPIPVLPIRSSALTTASGSSLSEIAWKFLKFCWVPLLGMVTWGET